MPLHHECNCCNAKCIASTTLWAHMHAEHMGALCGERGMRWSFTGSETLPWEEEPGSEWASPMQHRSREVAAFHKGKERKSVWYSHSLHGTLATRCIFGHKTALLTWSNVTRDFYGGINWSSVQTWVKCHLRFSCEVKLDLTSRFRFQTGGAK